MKKVTFLLLTLFLVSAFYSQVNAQLLLKDKFDYTAGSYLISNGWVNTGTTISDTLKVTSGNLTYGFYPYSTTTGSNMVLLQGKGSGFTEDVHKNFPNKVTSGTVYTSFLVRVDTADGDTTDYFFHYWANSTFNFDARLFVKDNKAGKFSFGLSKTSKSPKLTTTKFDYKKTYLVVVKYEIVGDSTGTDDKVSLFINPGATEPTTPDIAYQNGTSDKDVALYGISLRQGSAAIYKVAVDGFRSATMWDSLMISKAIAVTFQANMTVQISKGNFQVGKDTLVVRGSFQKDAGYASDWSGMDVVATDDNNDKVYTATVNLPADSAGKVYKYKFVKNSSGWESSSDRSFTLTAPGPQVLDAVYFNNESPAAKTYHFTFIADVSAIYGTGDGYFDPSRDSLLVMGLDWEGGTNVKGSRKMTETLQAGVYTTTLSVQATGDSTKWKFHAYPESHFSNAGWEAGNDNWFKYGTDTVITIGPRVPRITPSAPALTQDQPVLFQVNMNNAKNAYDNSPIPLTDIAFVGVKGSDSTIGAWAGNWVVADTASTPKTIIVLNDKGIMGDKVANDGIWSKLITFPAGTHGGSIEYKFACWYKDAGTHTTSTSVLDNEAGFGQNHSFVLRATTGTISLKNNFGEMTTDVKQVNTKQVPTEYALTQNYPNPFNPATTIRYSVPQSGIVTLKIFNMLGQEVATLVHAQQNAGNYEVSFDASRLSSGIYLYNLTSGAFSSTKKMMLVK